jgi:hypothetical protein
MASRGQLSIYDKLRIKYGLPDNPTPELVDRWRERTEQNIKAGYSREGAGRVAAAGLFPGFETRVYASEADTIDTLLTEALRK